MGSKQYVQKQQELIYGNVSLVEIDLLREGRWVVATCEDLYQWELRKPYRICVTRRETTEESNWASITTWAANRGLAPFG